MEINHKRIIFTRVLMEWVSLNLKEYPWRKNRTVFTASIAEMFLQRTKADQVKPVFEDFIRAFPTLQSLLTISKETLLTYYSRLGLIKRVDYFLKILDILKANKKDIDIYSADEIREFPGIGQYTLNAILCFGKNQAVPLVDSNIIRIFTRFFPYIPHRNPPKSDPFLWQFAAELLPAENYVEYNYGLIDFGSEICTPKNPRCESCPLQNECFYFSSPRK